MNLIPTIVKNSFLAKKRTWLLIIVVLWASDLIQLNGRAKPYVAPGGVRRIVIDAGHGGEDPGTSGTFTHEKEVALKIALKTGAFIKEHFRDIEIIYTREKDEFVGLNEIAEHANKHNPDLFICVHCNANPNKEILGAETYVMGLHKTRGNLDVAKRENSSILFENDYQKKYEGFNPNSEEANIIFSMFQNAYLDRSLTFASRVQEQFKGFANRTDRGVRQAGFLVLWKTKMPSVLIETGFLSNSKEEKFLASEKGQNQLAYSIFRAFREYKYDLEGRILTEQEKHEKMPQNWEFREESIKEELKKEDPKIVKVENKEKQELNIKPENKNTNINPTPKIDSTSLAKVNAMESLEYGLVFKVQVLNSDKKLSLKGKQFKGLEEVSEVESEGVFKYYSGKCKTPDEVTKYQMQMQEKGFKDAFPVAFKNGKRITMGEARDMLSKMK